MGEEPEEWSVAHSDPLDWITIERDSGKGQNGPQPTEEEIKSSVRKGEWFHVCCKEFFGLHPVDKDHLFDRVIENKSGKILTCHLLLPTRHKLF